MAHIIAAGRKGPRANATVTQVDEGLYNNLILLCANCHTTIDKAPADFPDNMIREWKRKHVERINSLFGVVEYPDRASAIVSYTQRREARLASNLLLTL